MIDVNGITQCELHLLFLLLNWGSKLLCVHIS